jgi:hypothetical protein
VCEGMVRTAACTAIVVWLTIACSSSSYVSNSVKTSPTVSIGGFLGSLGKLGCAPPATIEGSETGLDSKRGSFWALFFSPVPPSAGKEIKVVWRMTGSGAFTFRISDAGGKTVPLAWGPQGHHGSNWNHPGDEVGTGFNFPHRGCWDIHVARLETYGDLWLEVIA